MQFVGSAHRAVLALIMLCATLGESTLNTIKFLVFASVLQSQALLNSVEPVWHLEQVLLKPGTLPWTDPRSNIPHLPRHHLLLHHTCLLLHHTPPRMPHREYLLLLPLLQLTAHRLLHMVQFHHPAQPLHLLQQCVVCHTSAPILMILASMRQTG